MMLAARGAIRASGAGLPYDAEVEYLESSGTQYIDTGMSIDTSTDVIRCTFLPFANTGTYETYFGVGEKIDGANKFFEVRKNDGITKIIGLLPDSLTIKVRSGTSFNADGVWHNLTYSAGELVLDNYVNSFTPRPTTFSKTLYLFARHNLENDTAGIAASCRMSAFQHYRNGVLIRDFIPVRRGTVGYLYDRVTGRLFGNAGSGAFSYGSDVVQVEWLQTSGTQYVDTGVVPGPGLDYSISFAFTSMSSYSYIMGAWSSDGSNYYDLAEQSNTLIYAGLGTTQQAIANIPAGVFSTVEKRSLDIYIDGVKKKSYSADIQSGSISSTILLFGVHRNYGPGYIVAAQPLRVSKYSLTLNGVNIRNLLSVRVGTEGAMMDTLTRRIYRNAGTGAFAYGNDLKYPIPA